MTSDGLNSKGKQYGYQYGHQSQSNTTDIFSTLKKPNSTWNHFDQITEFEANKILNFVCNTKVT